MSALPEIARIPQIVEVNQLADRMEELYKTGGPQRGVSTGWPQLDPWWTVRKREWTVVTGHPNHGKSTWLDNLLMNLAQSEHWKFGIFSAENMPVERYVASFTELLSGRPFNRHDANGMDLDEMKTYTKWLDEHFVFINPTMQERRLSYLLEVGAWLVEDHRVDALVIDPWNELDHARPKHQREDEYISVSLSEIRNFARTKDVHFFVVAHPKVTKRENGKYPIPTMFDVKGASEWNAKADNGICVWRDMLNPQDGTDVHVQKVRFREVGMAGGGCKLFYQRIHMTGRYQEQPC